jgi:hypothetical protein
MTTKAELLARMHELGACMRATAWVRAHASDDAREIGIACTEVDWLIWYLGRTDRRGIAAFAQRCADRSGSPPTARAAARAAAHYAALADAFAPHAEAFAPHAEAHIANHAADAADAAAYAAHIAGHAAGHAAERKAQLDDLHAMWAACYPARAAPKARPLPARILTALRRARRPMTCSELTARLGAKRGSVSSTLHRLFNSGRVAWAGNTYYV